MPRGLSDKRKQMTQAAYEIAEERQPITVREIAYVLFELYGMIPDMSKASTNKVSEMLRKARENGVIPWEWIVDGSRSGRAYNHGGFDSPVHYADTILALNNYRKDYWWRQPYHLEVWSEKETIAGVIDPVLQKWAVDFKNLRGFNSASNVHDDAEKSRDILKPMLVLYLGDFDPSGLFMSERDLPGRLHKYGGEIQIVRIALTQEDTIGRIGHDVEEKAKDKRIKWWHENGFGSPFWEIDGMDPRDLRSRLDEAIESYVDMASWEQSRVTEAAERESVDMFHAFMQGQAERFFASQ
jgi:hypothetical protein